MPGFKLFTASKEEIRFLYYKDVAPETCKAFQELLPFERTFYHARCSGSQIFTDQFQSSIDHQENASVFVDVGEVVLGAVKPTRSKTSATFGIFYGEGRGIDASNIFAHVHESDREKLQKLGTRIWKEGQISLRFEPWD